MLPVWTFALADALLERRVWMEHGSNTTYVGFRLLRGSRSLLLELTPLVTYHGFHSLSSGHGWSLGVEAGSHEVVIRAFDGAIPFMAQASAGEFIRDGGWWWNFKYREETARGLRDSGDLYAPGMFSVSLTPDAPDFTLTLTTELSRSSSNSAVAHTDERMRQAQLLRAAGVENAHPVVQQLTLAADQFIVERKEPQRAASQRQPPGDQAALHSTSIIAGYHWFNDWGRDTMIALRGLTLATGRPQDANNILRNFARYISDGLLPNNFPDQSGVIPGYNTADATLWYVLAIYAYAEATGDETLVDDLLPTVREIISWHTRGARYHIGVDPRDGLLHAGEPGVQLTWMDAKVGEYVVTPRIGKPVEINALWYNSLRILTAFLAARGDGAAEEYRGQAERVRSSFLARFRRRDTAALADVVDGPNGDDWTLRPNQIFAISLPFQLLEEAEAAAVLDIVGRTLQTSYGLRSLDPANPAYRGAYGGDQYHRDTAYHQGPVWTWLMGPYAEAHYRTYHDPVAALALLRPFDDHLRDAGLGSVSEILEGDPPHLPRGCIAQAWSVAEVLRVWRELEQAIQAARVGPAITRPTAHAPTPTS
jgi:predicted glycogen debranching enzyme